MCGAEESRCWPSRRRPVWRSLSFALSAACVVVASALAGSEACAEEPAVPPGPAVTLTVGRQQDEAPLPDVSVAVVTEAFRRAGIGLALRRLTLPRSIEMANNGEIDGDLHRIALVVEKYPNLLAVPTPINRVDVAVYGAPATLAGKSRAEVSKLQVAIQRGIFVLEKYSRGMRVSDTFTTDSALEMLLNGHTDIVMLTYADAEIRLARRGIGAAAAPYTDIVRWPFLWASEPLYLVLHRRHAALVPRLDAALQEMQKEGVIERDYREILAARNIRLLQTDSAAGPTGKPVRH
ncbi:hypothetical protein BH11PSE8_BH11PSE8_19310 [soil metagenome]